MRRALPLLLLLWAGCVQSVEVPASPPALPAAPRELPLSQIDLPVEVDLSLLRDELERAVPRVYDREQAWERHGNAGLRYRVERGPIEVGFDGGALEVRSQLRYRARACVGFGRTCQQVASCGHGRDGMRRLDVGLRSPLALSDDWQLQTKTKASHRFVDPCRVTFLRFDIRKHLSRALARQLGPLERRLDRALAEETQLRERVEAAWRELQRPLAIEEGVWLVLAPSEVRVGPLRAQGDRLRFSIGAGARPRLVGGAAPVADPAPLPPLRRSRGGEGFSLYLRAELPYDEATRLLRRALVGKRFSAGGHRTVIREVVVRPGPIVALDVETDRGFFRKLRGTVHVAAQPHFDPATGTLSLESLDYTLETRSTVAQVAEYLLHPAILDELRENARWPLGERLDEARALASRALDRQLAPGIRLRGDLHAIEPLEVIAGADGFVASVAATGAASVSLGGASP